MASRVVLVAVACAGTARCLAVAIRFGFVFCIHEFVQYPDNLILLVW